jgi:hypothetical protein
MLLAYGVLDRLRSRQNCKLVLTSLMPASKATRDGPTRMTDPTLASASQHLQDLLTQMAGKDEPASSHHRGLNPQRKSKAAFGTLRRSGQYHQNPDPARVAGSARELAERISRRIPKFYPGWLTISGEVRVTSAAFSKLGRSRKLTFDAGRSFRSPVLSAWPRRPIGAPRPGRRLRG